jgi:isohexenylglutaconyl-CoA hydratase
MKDDLPNSPELQLNLVGGVLRVTINRPETRNALSAAVVTALWTLAEQLAERDDIRIVTLHGADGVFCAGGDIRGFREMGVSDDVDPLLASNRHYGELLVRWNALRQVTIALIEGAAFGGGLGLACVVDIALATRSTRFAVSETRLGVVPAQIAPFLVDRVGRGAARQAALTGRPFDGDDAKAIGLINEVYDDSAALAAGCETLIADILQCAPVALAETKALLLRVGNEPTADLMRDAADIFVSTARGPEGREGIAAFLEKRRPAWSLAGRQKGAV